MANVLASSCGLHTSCLEAIRDSIAILKNSKSHLEFSVCLSNLNELVVSPIQINLLTQFNLEDTFKKYIRFNCRFLLNSPASSDDMIILNEILAFITIIISQTAIFNQFKRVVLESISMILLPILECTEEIDGISGKLSETIITLLNKVFQYIDSTQLIKLASKSSILTTLTKFASFLLNSDAEVHRELNVRVITTLLHIVGLPSIVTIGSGQNIAECIELFVGVISKFQSLNRNFTDGDAFTYQERSKYRCAALALRSISRSVLIVHTTYKTWVWGRHWLFENDIDWLMQLLNDDEKSIQKIGLGVLGNLLLIKGSYEFLCVKIPQFLDVSFINIDGLFICFRL